MVLTMVKKTANKWYLVRKIGSLTIKTPYRTKAEAEKVKKFFGKQSAGKLSIVKIDNNKKKRNRKTKKRKKKKKLKKRKNPRKR